MKAFHVLDPACGCGNFLYVVYREMKRLEAALAEKWETLQRKVARRRADIAAAAPTALVHASSSSTASSSTASPPSSLASCSGSVSTSRTRELGLDEDTAAAQEPRTESCAMPTRSIIDWPRPEGELAIVGNPPTSACASCGTSSATTMSSSSSRAIPNNRAADYVTYWFTRALEVLRPGERAGFVCTNSIAQNESREASSIRSSRAAARLPTRGNHIRGRARPPSTSASSTGSWRLTTASARSTAQEVAASRRLSRSSTDVTVARRIQGERRALLHGRDARERRASCSPTEQRARDPRGGPKSGGSDSALPRSVAT